MRKEETPHGEEARSAVSNHEEPASAGASNHDAIIVLGAAVWRGGRASPALERRVAHGVELFRAGAAPHLIVTGGIGRHPPAEAVVMARLAEAMGVPRSRIIVEDQARNTFESAVHCTALMRKRGWRSALLVSDAFHLRRSLLAFRAFGIETEASAAGGDLGSLGLSKWVYHNCREAVGLGWYGLRLAAGGRGKRR